MKKVIDKSLEKKIIDIVYMIDDALEQRHVLYNESKSEDYTLNSDENSDSENYEENEKLDAEEEINGRYILDQDSVNDSTINILSEYLFYDYENSFQKYELIKLIFYYDYIYSKIEPTCSLNSLGFPTEMEEKGIDLCIDNYGNQRLNYIMIDTYLNLAIDPEIMEEIEENSFLSDDIKEENIIIQKPTTIMEMLKESLINYYKFYQSCDFDSLDIYDMLNTDLDITDDYNYEVNFSTPNFIFNSKQEFMKYRVLLFQQLFLEAYLCLKIKKENMGLSNEEDELLYNINDYIKGNYTQDYEENYSLMFEVIRLSFEISGENPEIKNKGKKVLKREIKKIKNNIKKGQINPTYYCSLYEFNEFI